MHPFEAISNDIGIWIFMALLLLTVILSIVMFFVDKPLRTKAARLGMVSAQLAGSVSKAQEILDSWDTMARIHAAFSLGLDYLYLLSYSNTIGLACILAASEFQAQGWFLVFWGAPLAWGQWLAALLDSVENIALFFMFRGDVREPWPKIAYWCAVPKFLLVIAGIAYALIGFFVWLIMLIF